MLLWTLFVLYPDPRLLVASAWRAWQPPLDPAAVRDLAATLPDDPREIEEYVNGMLVPYAVPWTTYGVPWYFPTVETVLARGEGDCQARAIVLASILSVKGIPARFVGSLDHLWVDYPGKRATSRENADIAFVAQRADGGYGLQRPRVDWRETWEIERGYFWDTMPVERVWLLLLGWVTILGRTGWSFAGRRARVPLQHVYPPAGQ
jgi:hypothetical protein